MPATDGKLPHLRFGSTPHRRVLTPFLALDPRECKEQRAWRPGARNAATASKTEGNQMNVSLLLRNLANVANLSTPLGIALSIAGRGRLRLRDGLVVADHVRLPVGLIRRLDPAGPGRPARLLARHLLDQPAEDVERLAQALIGAPRLLLLDEPTSGLDPVSRREFYEVLEASARAGTAVLLSSHSL